MSRSQTSLGAFTRPGFRDLTDAEADAYLNVDEGGHGMREYARQTDRSPGTVGNLLLRARRKLDGGDDAGG